MSENLSIFAEKIFYYENVIPDTTNLIYLIESTNSSLSENSLISKWEPWSASDGDDVFGMKKSTNKNEFSNADQKVKDIYTLIDSKLDEYGALYANSLNIPLGQKMPISISKYFLDAYMGPHTDSSPSPTTEHVSAVLYLNDNYSGGEINFPEQGVKIKPKAGSLVIFPSIPPFYHESLKILNGIKYMSPAFWHLTN